MTQVIDLTVYRATGHRIEYGDDLAQALNDLDKANRAVEKTLAMFKPKLAKFYKPWWEGDSA